MRREEWRIKNYLRPAPLSAVRKLLFRNLIFVAHKKECGRPNRQPLEQRTLFVSPSASSSPRACGFRRLYLAGAPKAYGSPLHPQFSLFMPAFLSVSASIRVDDFVKTRKSMLTS